ncbi:TonB-dependent receptor domain-containing protein [Stenotrophomonas rhizophila]|uniref:TonB-dependent receptor domain-containing protein n=1 Tax=Stenotrophomonas rhizophila TaxID=216778 RepID=UPI001E4A81FD|nr:TonB-dependent receptor [Stenotrophomonas rhizophila]MCC7633646.1 TonB-dependent receptor [Stenotrophomonas rhizophila]MCC7663592.1 TonB-dependent receptor [Stenotrophomonas rhizophila]
MSAYSPSPARLVRAPLALAVCLLLASPGIARADGAGTAAAKELDTVVVTASGNQQWIKDAPASISVISREDIERQPVHDLGTLLSRIPGVTGGLSAAGEQSKIKLRGMPSNYTLILVDGKRVGSSASTNYRPDLGRQDLNWIAPDQIERIEVVRGPMSSLYGSDAMGGVINIITRRIGDTWGGSATHSYTSPQDGKRGDTQQIGSNLSGPLTENIGMRIGANYTNRESDRSNGGVYGNAYGGEKDRNVDALLDWKISPAQSLQLEAGHGVQQAYASASLEEQGDGAWGASELKRTSLSLSHNGNWSFGTSKVTGYWTEFKNDIGPTGRSQARDMILEGSLGTPFTLWVDHQLSVGGQWKRQQLTNTNTIGQAPVDYAGNPVNGSTLEVDTWAVFVEDELKLHEKLALTVGARLDHHEQFGSHVSPRAYLVYHPASHWTLRGGISKGFRAPSLTENAAAAATQSGGRGCGSLRPLGYVTGGCYMAGNPDLDPETSTNREIGFNFDNGRIDAGLTWFHTDFRNKIEYEPLGKFHDYWWTRMENVERARTSGMEGNLNLNLGEQWRWRTSATWMKEARNLTTGENLIDTPEFSGYSSLDWTPVDAFSATLSAQYTGKQAGVASSFIKAYTLYDLTGAWQVNNALTVRAGVSNLADKKLYAQGATDYFVAGRSYFLGMTARF